MENGLKNLQIAGRIGSRREARADLGHGFDSDRHFYYLDSSAPDQIKTKMTASTTAPLALKIIHLSTTAPRDQTAVAINKALPTLG